jgi:hypothetical protein
MADVFLFLGALVLKIPNGLDDFDGRPSLESHWFFLSLPS